MDDEFFNVHSLRELSKNERPQERLEKYGPSNLSDRELLAMILRSGSKKNDVLSLSTDMINKAGSLSGLMNWSVSDFLYFSGIGKIKALQLLTIIEIARRILNQESNEKPQFNCPEQIYNYMRPVCLGLDIEKFWILCLSHKNRLIRRVEITSGISNGSLVHAREVYREAIRNGANKLVCIHNHPSGDPTPSQADHNVTQKMKQAGITLDIQLSDHIIIGSKAHDPSKLGYYSYCEYSML